MMQHGLGVIGQGVGASCDIGLQCASFVLTVFQTCLQIFAHGQLLCQFALGFWKIFGPLFPSKIPFEMLPVARADQSAAWKRCELVANFGGLGLQSPVIADYFVVNEIHLPDGLQMY